MTQRLEGTVVSYTDDRGFGFIRPGDGGADYFVRFTEIRMGSYRTLRVGGRVDFEPMIETGTGNRQALDVHPLD